MLKNNELFNIIKMKNTKENKKLAQFLNSGKIFKWMFDFTCSDVGFWLNIWHDWC